MYQYGFDKFIKFNITELLPRARVRISGASRGRMGSLGYRDVVRARNSKNNVPIFDSCTAESTVSMI